MGRKAFFFGDPQGDASSAYEAFRTDSSRKSAGTTAKCMPIGEGALHPSLLR